MASRPSKPDTSDFLKKFRRILKNPGIKTFQWSDNGKYVTVYWKHYETERGEHKEALSILKGVEDTTSLHRLLCYHGFMKLARRSRSNIRVFEHPNFVERVEDKERSKCSSSCDYLGIFEDTSPAMSSDVLSDMCFSPIKRKNARSLYQYINFSCPDPVAEPEEHSRDNPRSNLLCTSLAEGQTLDPGHSITTHCTETGKSVSSLSEGHPLQEPILNLCQISLLPPLSPHSKVVDISADLNSRVCHR